MLSYGYWLNSVVGYWKKCDYISNSSHNSARAVVLLLLLLLLLWDHLISNYITTFVSVTNFEIESPIRNGWFEFSTRFDKSIPNWKHFSTWTKNLHILCEGPNISLHMKDIKYDYWNYYPLWRKKRIQHKKMVECLFIFFIRCLFHTSVFEYAIAMQSDLHVPGTKKGNADAYRFWFSTNFHALIAISEVLCGFQNIRNRFNIKTSNKYLPIKFDSSIFIWNLNDMCVGVCFVL